MSRVFGMLTLRSGRGVAVKVFISWSGPLSHKVALVLRDWLPSVIQAVEPFVSSEDISKGTPWYPRIATELASSKAAIVVVTPENIGSVWVHYEAGALAKSLLDTDDIVAPLLIGLDAPQVKGPLVQLQITTSSRLISFYY